jgi:metal-responsive CopG/Arc/MetJ family transcriptional regulator
MAGIKTAHRLRDGLILAYRLLVTVQVTLPDELVELIDNVAADRSAFVAEAVRRHLRASRKRNLDQEVAAINAVVDQLNREGEDALSYQAFFREPW